MVMVTWRAMVSYDYKSIVAHKENRCGDNYMEGNGKLQYDFKSIVVQLENRCGDGYMYCRAGYLKDYT